MKYKYSKPHLNFIALALAAAALHGCIHGRTPLAPPTPVSGWPEARTIVADLAKNDAAIERIRAAGTFILEAPELSDTTYKLNGRVLVERPGAVYAAAYKATSKVVWLTAVGDESLLVLPREKEYYHLTGETPLEDGGRSLSMVDLTEALFFPVDWTSLAPGQMRVTAYDPATQIATLELLDPDPASTRVARRFSVQGAPWVVLEDTWFEEDGSIAATTKKTGYRDIGGIRFPGEVEAVFPVRGARLWFDIRSVWLNEPIPPETFAIAEKLEKLKFERYTERVPETGTIKELP